MDKTDPTVEMVIRKTASLGPSLIIGFAPAGPGKCACRGEYPQMKYHTQRWCSVRSVDI